MVEVPPPKQVGKPTDQMTTENQLDSRSTMLDARLDVFRLTFQRGTWQRVVIEIEKFIGRWRTSRVPPKIVVAHGPSAKSEHVSGCLSDELCERVLNNPSRYPMQWVLIAERSRSPLNVEQPLLPSATTWFED
jgi:hypothetical protein